MDLQLRGNKVIMGMPTLLWQMYKIWGDYIQMGRWIDRIGRDIKYFGVWEPDKYYIMV